MLINVEVDNPALPESSRGERTEMKDADFETCWSRTGSSCQALDPHLWLEKNIHLFVTATSAA